MGKLKRKEEKQRDFERERAELLATISQNISEETQREIDAAVSSLKQTDVHIIKVSHKGAARADD